MLSWAIAAAFALITLAMLLNLYRLFAGPSVPDRILALDTLYINTIALILLLGVYFRSNVYFEAALLIALIGFVGTLALTKYLTRGDIIE